MMPLSLVGSQQNVIMKTVSIRTSKLKSLPRFRKKPHKDDPFNLFAIHIHTNEDIEKMLSQPHGYVELRLTVRHGLSTLAKTFTQQYGDTDVIRKNMKFEYAGGTGVMNVNKTISV